MNFDQDPELQKKKKPRKAVLKYTSSSIKKKISESLNDHDHDRTILHILDTFDDQDEKKEIIYDTLNSHPVDDDIIGHYIDTTLNSQFSETSISTTIDTELDLKKLYASKIDTRIQQDTALSRKLEEIHNNDNLFNDLIKNITDKMNGSTEIKNIEDETITGYYPILKTFINNETEWPCSTNVCCWWCCHTFTSIPIGLPIKYSENKFTVRGVFCTFACVLAYKNDTNRSESNELINLLYKKLTGVYISDPVAYKKMIHAQAIGIMNPEIVDNYVEKLSTLVQEKLEPAPPRCTLKMFGGIFDIESFRNASVEGKIYNLVMYPMTVSRDYVEELDIQSLKDANKEVFKNTRNRQEITGISQYIQ